MAATKPFVFVCGPDDFLVNRLGKERFAELAKDITDEYSREILSGFANNVGEVAAVVNRLRESVQTLSMFGSKRAVWLKDVNFLADTPTGRAEGTLRLVEDLQQLLAGINPEDVSLLVTASPIDRRRSFPKWCEKHADFMLVGAESEAGSSALASLVQAEARACGVSFEEGALELLLARIGANSRLLVEETRKLTTYVDQGSAAGATLTEAHVAELTPNVAEGDFFEAADTFFRGDLVATLTALRRHFFTGGSARPIIAALQNRNRLLLQVRALLDAGEVRLGPRGLDGLARAAGTYGRHFTGVTEKSSFHVFTQNAWYVGKLATQARLPSLRRLIDNQREFIVAFSEIIRRPHEEEEVLRELAVRCLT